MAIKSKGYSATFFQEVIDKLNELVADSVIGSSDTVAQAITQMTTERDNL